MPWAWPSRVIVSKLTQNSELPDNHNITGQLHASIGDKLRMIGLILIRKAAVVRGGIGDFSSRMEIDIFLCKIRFRIHRIMINDKTLPKAQRTRGLSSYHKLHTNLDQTSISQSRLSFNSIVFTIHQHLN